LLLYSSYLPLGVPNGLVIHHAQGLSAPTLTTLHQTQQIAPLLTRIQALKGGKGGALSGIQLMAFFVQCRVQPLQHRLSKLWSYSGLVDTSRVSGDLTDKQEVDKRVRSLTKLTKDHAVAELAADYFDSMHPLPKVCICLLCTLVVEFHWFPIVFILVLVTFLTYSFVGPPIPCFTPSSSRRRASSG
jgi:hypothetical protein